MDKNLKRDVDAIMKSLERPKSQIRKEHIIEVVEYLINDNKYYDLETMTAKPMMIKKAHFQFILRYLKQKTIIVEGRCGNCGMLITDHLAFNHFCSGCGYEFDKDDKQKGYQNPFADMSDEDIIAYFVDIMNKHMERKTQDPSMFPNYKFVEEESKQ